MSEHSEKCWVERVRDANPDSNGCIRWPGAINKEGYGIVWYKERCSHAHRMVYEREVGPIQDGMQIDHLCRNRSCVNVEHLEVVTPYENFRRGEGVAAKNIGNTHCVRGHELSGHNLMQRPDGRRCRKCVYMGNAAWRKRKQMEKKT